MFRKLARFFRRGFCNVFGIPYLDVRMDLVGSEVVIDVDYNVHFIFHLDTIGYSGYESADDKVMAYIEASARAAVTQDDMIGDDDDQE